MEQVGAATNLRLFVFHLFSEQKFPVQIDVNEEDPPLGVLCLYCLRFFLSR